ncbi:MAG: glycosyl transferase family 2 [Frankiales bacterium]|nr:glycosyl transferase family 2 [Frankiales bacterium]
MAGPAIRAWQFASALSAKHDVELVTSAACTPPAEASFPVRHIEAAGVRELLTRTDVWVVQGSILLDFPAIEASDAVVVVDLYDPYHLENLELRTERPMRDRLASVHNATAVLNRGIRRADLMLAASDKQRDFWLGALATLGRVNPLTYEADHSLRELITIVPFGVDDHPPVHTKPVLRDVVPGISDTDLVLIWGGGIYNWFDPLTLIRAVAAIDRDDVRLVFLGGKHPNPALPSMQMAVQTHALADELGLTGTKVFFNDRWVPYDERASYLLEADVGVSTHLDHVETAFSFRTRILDYLWAGLPVVATGGDVFADLIESRGLGATVPPGDVAALTQALTDLLADDTRLVHCRDASRKLADELTWSTVLGPLLAFCDDPQRAPDLVHPGVADHLRRPFDVVRAPTPGPPGWRGEVALAQDYLAKGGLRLLVRRVLNRAGKLLRGRTS